MAAVCILDEFEVHKNEKFLEIAESLKPKLHERLVRPQRILGAAEEDYSELSGKQLKKDDRIVLDFGDHQVGHVTMKLSCAGSHQDAPAYIYLRFAERIEELDADPAQYDGWISKGWLQEEYIHVDVLPAEVKLPRRYAFRYMEIKVIDVSMKFSLVIDEVSMKAVSAVREEDVPALETDDPLLKKIDRVAVHTLQNCMQDVFEDGSDKRMNIPGSAYGNWGYRYYKDQFHDGLKKGLREMSEIYGR